MSAWDKLVFGWLDYQLVKPGDGKTKITLGPSEAQSTVGQAGRRRATCRTGTSRQSSAPRSRGSKFYYSGTGDDMDNTMVKSVTLPAGSPSLTAKARYNIETDWDYAYVIVSTDGGAHFDIVHDESLDEGQARRGRTSATGITGVSTDETGSPDGGPVGVRRQDGPDRLRVLDRRRAGRRSELDATPGIALDNIAITRPAARWCGSRRGLDIRPATVASTSRPASRSPARSSTPTSSRTVSTSARTSSVSGSTARSASRRTTSAAPSAPNWAERHPYEDGVLIWYWNTQYANNNVGDHPGEGEILPVDAHPRIMHWADGSVVRARIESYDSTFGVKKTDAITLHKAASRRSSSRSRACRSSTTCRTGGRRPIRVTPSASTRPAGRRQRPEDRHQGGGQGRHEEGLLGRHRGHARRRLGRRPSTS